MQVAVSEEMFRLRSQQTTINSWLWSSEYAYGYLRHAIKTESFDASAPASIAFAHVDTAALVLNAQGRPRYDYQIKQMYDHLETNARFVFAAAVALYKSYFEDYLKSRIGFEKGQFLGLYRKGAIAESGVKPQLRTVLKADLCRHLRNLIIHSPHELPVVSDPRSDPWVCRRGRDGNKEPTLPAEWCGDLDVEYVKAYNEVVGGAVRNVELSKAAGRDIPIELFYSLFTFTNLDALAFETEEALIGTPSEATARVMRLEREVRRKDLIVPT